MKRVNTMTYYWKCIYNDGTEISSKVGAKYKDIDRTKLDKFILLEVDTDKVVLAFSVSGERRLICRTRNAISTNNDKMIVWICGYQVKIGDYNSQIICFVFPDGMIEVTDEFKKDHQWYYPIKFLPEEL